MSHPDPAELVEATMLFNAMSNQDRWAYWADECSLADIFDSPVSAPVRKLVCEMVNAWVQNPS